MSSVVFYDQQLLLPLMHDRRLRQQMDIDLARGIDSVDVGASLTTVTACQCNESFGVSPRPLPRLQMLICIETNTTNVEDRLHSPADL
jgi:hypothetical protein